MSERITKVEEFTERGENYATESGFDITTTEQTITLAIDDYQSCCESWGYFLAEDDASRFVGAELCAVSITDTNRSNRTFYTGWDYDRHESDKRWPSAVEGAEDEALDEGDVLFVDIETDRGVLQFVAYNAHNGYYGHTARVSSRQLQHEATL